MRLTDLFQSFRPSVIIVACVTFVFYSNCTRRPTLCGAAIANQEALIIYQVVPKLFRKFPPHAVEVEYGYRRKVDFGSIFTMEEIDNPPSRISWPVERKYERAKSRFALGMFGPDLPTREVAMGEYQWQHWLIIDIPGNKWREGRVVTEYRAYEPFYINDLHRVFFIVYRQRGKDPLNYTDPYVPVNAPDDVRGFFSWNGLMYKYGFYEPYAINFLQLNCTGTTPILGFTVPTDLQADENIKKFFDAAEKDSSDEARGFFSWDKFCGKYNFYEPYAINFLRLNRTGTEPILGKNLEEYEKNIQEYLRCKRKNQEFKPLLTNETLYPESTTMNQTRWVFD